MVTAIVIAAVVLLLSAMAFFLPLGLFISARFTGVRISIGELIAMRIRNVPIKKIVDELIKAQKGGLKEVDLDGLEEHHLAEGDIVNVVDALIAAKNAGIDLDFKTAKAVNLAKIDIFQAVKDAVTTKVIRTGKIEATAKNGVQVIAIAQITVKPRIGALIGGATEDTILARVGQAIVSTIGQAQNHQDIMADPERISKAIIKDNLSQGTAFEVLSVDIADVDLGENVGAKLRADEANARLREAKADAEKRASEARAAEQEYKAQIQLMKARLVEAEAQVPLAMAEALRNGKIHVMDYLKVQNMQADTRMRESFAQPESETHTVPEE